MPSLLHTSPLPLSLALPDANRALPQWITAPHAWGARAPYAPDELGDWIWAPADLENAPFELVGEFSVDPHRGVVGAYATGAAFDEDSVVVAAINGVIGTAGGALDARRHDYRGFEGELSPWLRGGTNRLAIKVQPSSASSGANENGSVFRLIVRYADGGAEIIATDESWRAFGWDGTVDSGVRMSVAPDVEADFDEGAPVRVIATREVPREYARPRLYASAWAAPLLRREFTLEAAPKRAVLTVCGLGCYEAHINGARVGDHLLDPAQTSYETRAFYVTYDVTDQLHCGANALGVMLGHGWFGQNVAWAPHIEVYGKPAALVQLEIEDENGVTVINSDAHWRAATGAITSDNLYRGEIYDARLERPNWTSAGDAVAGDSDDWETVEIVAPLSPNLEAQTIPPIRRQQEFVPVGLTEPKPKMWVFDIGENIVGWAKLRVCEPNGTRIKLRFAEALNDDGTLNFHSTGPFATRVVQQDEYICRGDATEIWEPRFTYHGFQYVEVSGLTQAPTLQTITGVAIHTDLESAGEWSSSDATLNAIEKVSRRSLVGNLHGIITDCPHRERCQWQADAEIIADYALYRYAATPLFAKCMDDCATTLDARGLPREINVGRRTPPLIDIGWSTLTVQVAWRILLFAGDLEPARAHLDLMRFVCDYYHDLHPDGIVRAAGHGDHAAPPFTHAGEPLPECPRDGYATMLLFESTQTLAQIAEKLGRDADAAHYFAAAARVRAAFIARFYEAESGGYAHPTLDAYALLLDVYPDGALERLVAHFRAQLKRHDWMNVGGFFGYRRIAEAAILFLPQHEALQVLTQAAQPGVPYAIARGATSIWEQYYPDSDPDFRARSLNHFACGSVCENFWRHIAGLAPDAEQPGFRRVILKPQLTQVLEWASASHRAPLGEIRSAWKRDENGFAWQITLPRGASGRAIVPVAAGERVMVNGRIVSDASDGLELAAGNYLVELSG